MLYSKAKNSHEKRSGILKLAIDNNKDHVDVWAEAEYWTSPI